MTVPLHIKEVHFIPQSSRVTGACPLSHETKLSPHRKLVTDSLHKKRVSFQKLLFHLSTILIDGIRR